MDADVKSIRFEQFTGRDVSPEDGEIWVHAKRFIGSSHRCIEVAHVPFQTDLSEPSGDRPQTPSRFFRWLPSAVVSSWCRRLAELPFQRRPVRSVT